MLPMFAREVVKGEHGLGVPGQTDHPVLILDGVFSLNASVAASAAARVSALKIARRSAVTAGCMDFGTCLRGFAFGHSFEPMAVMPAVVEPAPLMTGAGEALVHRTPKPQGTVANRQLNRLLKNSPSVSFYDSLGFGRTGGCDARAG